MKNLLLVLGVFFSCSARLFSQAIPLTEVTKEILLKTKGELVSKFQQNPKIAWVNSITLDSSLSDDPNRVFQKLGFQRGVTFEKRSPGEDGSISSLAYRKVYAENYVDFYIIISNSTSKSECDKFFIFTKGPVHLNVLYFLKMPNLDEDVRKQFEAAFELVGSSLVQEGFTLEPEKRPRL